MSLTPEIAIQDRDEPINGVSIGVWNENPGPSFHWQFGFVNGATGDKNIGAQWFFFLATIYNYADNYTGLQNGWVNNTQGDFLGLQLAWIGNYAGNLTGAQLGAVNIMGGGTGFQWGVVNYAATADNLFQLGLVNIIADNPWFSNFPGEFAPGFIIANWSFGGE